jgi:hypothetical protein
VRGRGDKRCKPRDVFRGAADVAVPAQDVTKIQRGKGVTYAMALIAG